MRRRNLCPGFGLPVAGSPGTPFFSFFPFFSSLFFFFFGRRKWRNPKKLRRRGEAEPRATVSSTRWGTRRPPNPKRHSPSSRSSLFFSFFFFFVYFGRRKWRNPEQLRCRGEAELLRRRSRIVGEEEDHPTQKDIVLRCFIFFFKKRQAQNSVVLGFQQPKRRCFRLSQP